MLRYEQVNLGVSLGLLLLIVFDSCRITAALHFIYGFLTATFILSQLRNVSQPLEFNYDNIRANLGSRMRIFDISLASCHSPWDNFLNMLHVTMHLKLFYLFKKRGVLPSWGWSRIGTLAKVLTIRNLPHIGGKWFHFWKAVNKLLKYDGNSWKLQYYIMGLI